MALLKMEEYKRCFLLNISREVIIGKFSSAQLNSTQLTGRNKYKNLAFQFGGVSKLRQ
jgi:hypothetical protein